MAQIQGQILEDGNSEDEETRVSIRNSSFVRKELEVIVIRTVHQLMEQTILPKISAIVKQELDKAIEKHLTGLNHHSGVGVQSSESRTLQLQFMDKLSLPVLTRSLIKGEGPNPFSVALVDATTKQFVTSGREAFAKVEIVAVKGDFDGENWTLEEFNDNIVRGKDGKKSILTGNVHLNLEGGVGIVREISFTHNSRWRKVCMLRLGAKVVDNLNGTRVREAVTEPFVLKDFRNTYYKKHFPPSPNDEVWRLTKIAKDGPFHNLLVGESIRTVKDFLTRYLINPQSLQNILGAGKMWESIVAHAQTCKILRLYFPIGSGKKSGVVFNTVGQVMGLISECCYFPHDVLSEDQKADANKLVVSALEHVGDVMTFDDETSLRSHLLERPSHYNCEPLHAHYGHDHTQPSSSSHNNQVVPFHLPDAANASNIPSTDSLDVGPSFGNESYLNEDGLDYFIHEGSVIFCGNSFSPSLCWTEPMVDTDHSHQYLYPSSEEQGDLSSFIIDDYLSSPAADISEAQRRWSRLSNVLRSVRKIAALKLMSSEAVLASKRPRIC